MPSNRPDAAGLHTGALLRYFRFLDVAESLAKSGGWFGGNRDGSLVGGDCDFRLGNDRTGPGALHRDECDAGVQRQHVVVQLDVDLFRLYAWEIHPNFNGSVSL